MTRGSDYRVRAYRPRDFRAVTHLWVRTGIRRGPSDRRNELDLARRRDPDLFLVAEHGRTVVGVVLGRFDGRRGWINHLAVDPRHQARGLGAWLVRQVERRLARKGCLKVNLHVEPANENVCAFYLRQGYARRELIFLEKWLRPG